MKTDEFLKGFWWSKEIEKKNFLGKLQIPHKLYNLGEEWLIFKEL